MQKCTWRRLPRQKKRFKTDRLEVNEGRVADLMIAMGIGNGMVGKWSKGWGKSNHYCGEMIQWVWGNPIIVGKWSNWCGEIQWSNGGGVCEGKSNHCGKMIQLVLGNLIIACWELIQWVLGNPIIVGKWYNWCREI